MNATAIILAGKREGRLDPLAAEAGVDSKALVPIAGEPLIRHVLRAVLGSRQVGEVRVVGHGPDLLRTGLQDLAPPAGHRVSFVPAATNLVDSVLVGAAGASFPLLITTADNVLLTPAAINAFIAGASGQAPAGAAAAMVRKDAVLAAHPTGQRKFYRFTDGEFSNCNLYWIGHAHALAAAESFRSGGQFVKYPLRIAQAFGIGNLIRFGLGLGSAQGFFDRLSRRFGFPLSLIEMSDGACAIDVDNQRSFAIASELLERRSVRPIAA